MRKILIQTHTDRGTETRISTRNNELTLNVVFKGIDGIRAENVELYVGENGNLNIRACDTGGRLECVGKPAEKLSYKY